MQHYLNVCDINGATVPPVDIITFGSPCQDLSVAGKGAGLKHEDKGDEETTRSGLFMEAVRIIKEMRKATDGKYPRYALWENVPGAFISNGGEDFRIVVEELAKITNENISIPRPPKGKWSTAGRVDGDGWSLAWRTVDAQYHGVPQRRRRILLVADFTGNSAAKISFKCAGLPGYSSEGGEERQETAGASQSCTGADHRKVEGFDPYNAALTGSVSSTLGAHCGMPTGRTGVIEYRGLDAVDQITNSHILADQGGSFINVLTDGKAPTIRAQMGGHAPIVMQPSAAYGIGRDAFNQGKNAKYGMSITEEIQLSMTARGPGAVAYGFDPSADRDVGQYFHENCANTLFNGTCPGQKGGVVTPEYIARRLTPTECARLQGFPDWWGSVTKKDSLTDEEYQFWLRVRNTHAEIYGKTVKGYTKAQMLAWYNKLWSDTAEYKMWGNGVALPCVRVPIRNMSKQGARTLGSLFDGSGGFPLAGLLEGITPLWASEIEPYPIAVTCERFHNIEPIQPQEDDTWMQ